MKAKTLETPSKTGKPNTLMMALGGIVILLGVAFFVLASPSTPVPYPEDATVDYAPINSEIGGALVSGGIVDYMVDVQADRAYIAYELPEGQESDQMQRFAIGVTASAIADSGIPTIVVVQFENSQAKTSWTVATNDVKAFVRGEITGDQLEAKIQKQDA